MADETFNRDGNHVPVAGAVTDNASEETRMWRIDDTTKGLLVTIVGGAGSGTVTSVSVVSANGFAGSVATATTTPAITLSTTITGILQGNGTALSAITVGTGLSFAGGTLSSTVTGTVTSVAMSVPTGLTITGSPVTTTGTLAVALDTGYVIPLQSTLDGKANTALSNLASVAINTSLISDTDSTDSIGSTGVRWLKGWFDDMETTNAPTIGGTSIYATTATFTNKAITQRVVTTTDDATAVIDVAVTDVYELSAIANNTTFSFTGSPTDGQKFIVRYKDAGVSKTLTWTGFVAIGITLPTATTANKWGYVGVIYNSAASAYHAVTTTTEA